LVCVAEKVIDEESVAKPSKKMSIPPMTIVAGSGSFLAVQFAEHLVVILSSLLHHGTVSTTDHVIDAHAGSPIDRGAGGTSLLRLRAFGIFMIRTCEG
jgi:hypothetical protein